MASNRFLICYIPDLGLPNFQIDNPVLDYPLWLSHGYCQNNHYLSKEFSVNTYQDTIIRPLQNALWGSINLLTVKLFGNKIPNTLLLYKSKCSSTMFDIVTNTLKLLQPAAYQLSYNKVWSTMLISLVHSKSLDWDLLLKFGRFYCILWVH